MPEAGRTAAGQAGGDGGGGALSVLVAASNEEDWIGRCLQALLAQDRAAGRLRILVSANACRDRTVAVVQGLVPQAAARGWELRCLDSPEPGKVAALNRGEAALGPLAPGDMRAYLDADVLCEPPLLGQIRRALAGPDPAWASGTLALAPARSWITRRYGGLWMRLPFVRGGAVGAGFFAVNAAGRARWGEFPPVISDDTFVRLHFAPGERREVPARYHWPMVEGWANLVRVRRRQDAGVAEIRRLYPDLAASGGSTRPGPGAILGLAAAAPLDFAVYAAVSLAVRRRRPPADWSRGR